MPAWMKPLASLFGNTGGNDIERLVNDYGNHLGTNIVLYIIINCVREQAWLLRRLHQQGLIRNPLWWQRYHQETDLLGDTVEDEGDAQRIGMMGRSVQVRYTSATESASEEDFCAEEACQRFPHLSELIWMNITHPDGHFQVSFGDDEHITTVQLKTLV